MTQQVVGAEEMIETDRKVGDNDPGGPLHTPGESHASDEPVGGEGRPGVNSETAVEYPKGQTPI